VVRRLDDAAVVFDPRTWQTHLLPPAAAAVADLVAELAESGPVSAERISTAVRVELGVDPDAPEFRELLRMLAEIGMLDG
jgi:PqqD family protein of HPr-rel-A system